MNDALLQTDLQLPGLRRGKVRDVYDLPGSLSTLNPSSPSNAPNSTQGSSTSSTLDPRLLIVATDRISAFDVVMPTPIAGKGRLLTELSTFWLRFIERRGICLTHIISTNVETLPASAFFPGGTTREQLAGRSTIAKKATVVPIECVVRGYLEGSGWKEYQNSGSVCGIALPPGLKQCDKLPEPIFTPATKEEAGKHDENISFDRACQLVGADMMKHLRSLSLAIYAEASTHARSRGIIIADTKFEFGVINPSLSGDSYKGPSTQFPGEVILVDEALTPDSSRFWPADTYEPGCPQKSFDKQFLREYLEDLVKAGKWNKTAPGPELPEEIAQATYDKYQEAVQRLINT